MKSDEDSRCIDQLFNYHPILDLKNPYPIYLEDNILSQQDSSISDTGKFTFTNSFAKTSVNQSPMTTLYAGNFLVRYDEKELEMAEKLLYVLSRPIRVNVNETPQEFEERMQDALEVMYKHAISGPLLS